MNLINQLRLFAEDYDGLARILANLENSDMDSKKKS